MDRQQDRAIAYARDLHVPRHRRHVGLTTKALYVLIDIGGLAGPDGRNEIAVKADLGVGLADDGCMRW